MYSMLCDVNFLTDWQSFCGCCRCYSCNYESWTTGTQLGARAGQQRWGCRGPLGIRASTMLKASACAWKYALQLQNSALAWPGFSVLWLATNDSVGTGHAHYVPSGITATTTVKFVVQKVLRAAQKLI